MFELLTPPGEEKALVEAAREVLQAAVELSGKPMDVEGFLYSWHVGTKVVVERDDATRKITGLCIFAAGKQWPHVRTVGHILRLDGNREGLLNFAITLCRAMDVEGLYIEDESAQTETETEIIHVVREIKLKG